MSSPLRDIPGAGGGRRRDRLPSGARSPRSSGPVRRVPSGPVGGPKRPGSAPIAAKGRRRSFGSKQPIDRVNLAIGFSFAALAIIGGLWMWNANQVTISSTGVENGATISPQQAVGLKIEIAVSPASRLDRATLTFDGEDVTDDAGVEVTDDGFTWRPPTGGGLPDGDYTLALEVPKLIRGTAEWQLSFSVQPAH